MQAKILQLTEPKLYISDYSIFNRFDGHWLFLTLTVEPCGAFGLSIFLRGLRSCLRIGRQCPCAGKQQTTSRMYVLPLQTQSNLHVYEKKQDH